MAEQDGSSSAEKLTFLLIGAGIGATLALLFAPKSGRELRGDIVDYSRRGWDVASEGARTVGTKATDIYGAASGRVADVYGTAREKLSSGAGAISDVAARQKESFAAAIEAGKQAYREEKRKAGEGAGRAVEGEEAI
jgi:gas vesicle protein